MLLVLRRIVQHCSVQQCILQQCIVQHCIVEQCIVQQCIVQPYGLSKFMFYFMLWISLFLYHLPIFAMYSFI